MVEVAVAPIGISVGCLGTSLYYQYAIDTVVGLAGGSQTNFTALSIVASYSFFIVSGLQIHTHVACQDVLIIQLVNFYTYDVHFNKVVIW